MAAVLPLDRMTTSDKLRAMEEIWNDLLRKPDEIPSPAWHADVLKAREERVQRDESHFRDWTDAKGRIRERTR